MQPVSDVTQLIQRRITLEKKTHLLPSRNLVFLVRPVMGLEKSTLIFTSRKRSLRLEAFIKLLIRWNWIIDVRPMSVRIAMEQLLLNSVVTHRHGTSRVIVSVREMICLSTDI